MSTPLLAVFVAGLWAGAATGSLVLAVVVCLFLAVVAILNARHGEGTGPVLLAAALAAGLLAGATLAMARAASLRAWTAAAQTDWSGGWIEAEARVVGLPRRGAHGSTVVVRLRRIENRPTTARLLVQGKGVAELSLGAVVGLQGRLDYPGEDSYGRWLRSRHVAAVLHAEEIELITPPTGFWAAVERLREGTSRVTERWLSQDAAALLRGLVLGDRDVTDPLVEQQFRDSGLTHLVVVSGRHVGLLLAAGLGLAIAVGTGPRARLLLGLGLAGAYAAAAGAAPSVLRAGLMAAIVLVGRFAGRARRPLHALVAAVLLWLLVDPFLARQAGFALSVLATAGVLVIAPWLVPSLPGPRALRVVVAATAGAQAAAAPLLVALFDGVALWALPANLIAVPAAGLAQILGIGAALGAMFHDGLAVPFVVAARAPLAVVLWSAATFSTGPRLGLGGLVVVGVCGWLLLGRHGVPAGARRTVVLAAVVMAVVGWSGIGPAPSIRGVKLTMIDVGQGDALLLEVPATAGHPAARLLVDAGPDATTVSRWLRRHRIRRLDAVVLSHPHHDHSGGLAAVIGSLDVGALVVARATRDPATGAASAAAALATAHRRGVPLAAVSAGQRLRLGAAVVHVLSPPATGVAQGNLNDQSLVLRVDVAGVRILLTGDAEAAAQARLLTRPAQLRADFLKVPHHGGATNAPGFLRAVGASWAVIGVGQDNEYGHPHPATLRDLGAATVRRTDLDGTVSVGAAPRQPDVLGVAVQQVADHLAEPLRADRLREVGMGAEFLGSRLGGGRGVRGQDDELQPREDPMVAEMGEEREPVHARQAQIEHDGIGLARLQQIERLLRRGCRHDLVAGDLQAQPHHEADVGLIVHHHHRATHWAPLRTTTNREPLGSTGSYPISPPNASTRRRQRARPMPDPPTLPALRPRVNGSKSVSTSSGSTPGPSSVTVVTTWPSSRSAATWTRRPP